MAYLRAWFIADPRCSCGWSHGRRMQRRADIEHAILDNIDHETREGPDHAVWLYFLTQVIEYKIWTEHWEPAWFSFHRWGVYGVRPTRHLLERA